MLPWLMILGGYITLEILEIVKFDLSWTPQQHTILGNVPRDFWRVALFENGGIRWPSSCTTDMWRELGAAVGGIA